MDLLHVLEAQCNWVEQQGFELRRDEGIPHYIVAQYLSQIELYYESTRMKTPRGSILVLEPYVPHGYHCNEALLHHWFHLDGDVLPLLSRYGIQPNVFYQLGNAEDLSRIFEQIARIYHDKGCFRDNHLALKVEELFVCMGTQIHLQASASDLNYNVIKRLQELRFHILEHPEYDWSVGEMARQMFLSESYFHQLYRKCFGVTPNRDLIAIRIERARTNLMCGASVATASKKSGYANVYHFIRQFKKVMGVTPNQYKHGKRA